VKACTLVATPVAGVGTVTVTGVVDKFGSPFVGKAFIFHGNSDLNVLETPFQQSYGFDVLTQHYGQASGANNAFNLKTITSGTAGNSSVYDEIATFFFGGTTGLVAYVSAARSGEFDITTTYSVRAGHKYLVTVLGGDDLLVNLQQVSGAGSNPTITVGFPPEAVMFKEQALFSAGDTNSGQATINYGWATRNSGQGAAATEIQNGPGGNARFLSAAYAFARLSALALFDARTVIAWNPTSYQVDGSISSPTAGLALGGIQAAAGSLTQPASAGLQEIVTGLDNQIVFLASVGGVTDTGVQASPAMWSVGMIDGTRQGGYWMGEGLVGDGTLTGARYLSTTDVLRFATPNAGSTTFTAIAQSAGFSVPSRSFSLNWTVVDGVAREVIWLALGDEPPPIGTTYEICRLRRAPHLNLERKRIFYSRFELDMEVGLGTTDDPTTAPLMRLRWSDDGGQTWSSYYSMSAGQASEFGTRMFRNRLGSSRDRVYEVSTCDDAAWRLLAAYLDVTAGTH
jgi:hypothetical protein